MGAPGPCLAPKVQREARVDQQHPDLLCDHPNHALGTGIELRGVRYSCLTLDAFGGQVLCKGL